MCRKYWRRSGAGKKLHGEVESVQRFAYLGDRVSTRRVCKSAVMTRTRCGWVKFRECGELLYGRRFPLNLKWAFYKSYVRPAILYGSKGLCLIENETGILRSTERSTVRVMCVEYSS